MTKDFWELDQNKMSKEEICRAVDTYFSDEFIENYEMWKDIVYRMNEDFKTKFSKELGDNYIPMNFDDFCKSIIESMKEIINSDGKIKPDNISPMINVIGQNFIIDQIERMNSQIYSIEGIKKVIKRVYGEPRVK